jgi:hypothetical protein
LATNTYVRPARVNHSSAMDNYMSYSVNVLFSPRPVADGCDPQRQKTGDTSRIWQPHLTFR